MKLNAGLPYSLIRYGLICDYPPLGKNIKTEVAIIGGGISGAMTAYELTRAGIANVVVDARTIGLGSTAASTSLLQYELDVPLFQLSEMIGEKKAQKVYHCCREAVANTLKWAKQLKVADARQKQSVYFSAGAVDNDYLQQEFRARKKAGFDVTLLSASESKRKTGVNALSILSEDGGEVDSYLFTHALHQYNISKGALVFDRTQVKKAEETKQGVVLKVEGGYEIKAKYLVNACGYEAINYIDKPLVKLSTTFALASESYSHQEKFPDAKLLYWSTGNPYLYFRTTNDKRILLGGRDLPYSQAVNSMTTMEKRKRLLLADFKKLFPSVEFKTEFSWSGVFGSTADGMPYIGKYPAKKRSFFALGYGGNGIVFSQIAAGIIKDMVVGKSNSINSLFSFDR